jgi:aminopeptidase-like protein
MAERPVLAPELRWLEDVHLLQRSLVSEGFERTLDVVEGLCGDGFRRHAFACGSEVFTWIVPPRWSVRAARIEARGEVLVDAAVHPLHLVTHSAPFRGRVDRATLLSHLHSDPERPDAIPFRYSFYNRTWGFCVPHSSLPRFSADEYDVLVDTELSDDGELLIGELTLPGRSGRRLALTAHLDHPGQIDDGLGGAAALIELIRRFRAGGGWDGYFTLTFLFTCETIGSLCYLSRFEDEARETIEGCIAPEALGKPQPLAFGETFTGDTQLDRAAACVFGRRFAAVDRRPFLYLLANDDQVFDGPGFLIPSLAVARAPFPEYHSSLDSPERFDQERFHEGVDVLEELLRLLDRNVVPLPRFKNIPFLSRYGIWFDWCDVQDRRNRLERLFRLLDGDHSLVDLAVETGLKLDVVEEVVGAFAEHGLVELAEPRPLGWPGTRTLEAARAGAIT